MFPTHISHLLKQLKDSRLHKMHLLKLPGISLMMEFSNQMLEPYDQNRVPQGSDIESYAGSVPSPHTPTKIAATNGELPLKQISSLSAPEDSYDDNHGEPTESTQSQGKVNGSAELDSVITDHKVDVEMKDEKHPDQVPQKETKREDTNISNPQMERDDQDRNGGRNNNAGKGDSMDNDTQHMAGSIVRNLEIQEAPHDRLLREAIKIDKDKVKAALEKMRKYLREMAQKKDVMDEYDILERELEDGVEVAMEDEQTKQQERSQSSSISDDEQTLSGTIISRIRERKNGREDVG